MTSPLSNGEVCTACNNGLGQLDQAIIEYLDANEDALERSLLYRWGQQIPDASQL